MSDHTEDRARLSGMLTSLGYEVENDGEKGIRINTGGLHATVVVYDDGSLSLVCSVAGGGVDLRLTDVNDANSRVRFAKFSVDDGNLLLEADFVFSLAGWNAIEQLKHIMQLWQLALQELKHLVAELVQAD